MKTRVGLRDLKGVARSLIRYRMRPLHGRGLDQIYRAFVGPGDLALDVGAHVGDRLAAFRRLGTRVVAMEPNATLFRVLGWLHGRDSGVTLLPDAAGVRSGPGVLHLNRANPTVSTMSDSFVEAARATAGWRSQVWNESVAVSVLTLDDVIARHGRPAFIKIDAEGFEPEILTGLSRLPPVVSFEITTMARAAGLAALDRTVALGCNRFKFSLGESHRFVQPNWIDGATMRSFITALPEHANSGDVYGVADDWTPCTRPSPS